MWSYFFYGATGSSKPGPPHYRVFTITLQHTARGKTPLDEWSVRRRCIYLTTHNRKISITPEGFEPAMPASERPQAHVLDRVATLIGVKSVTRIISVQRSGMHKISTPIRPHAPVCRGVGEYASLARPSAWTHTHQFYTHFETLTRMPRSTSPISSFLIRSPLSTLNDL